MSSLVEVKKGIVDVIQSTVGGYVRAGELNLPADYSVGNALKSAFLMLQGIVTRDKQPVLEVCTQVSIHNALYSMVVQGLNPEKKQCYFIAYGKTLSCQRSYFGTMALAKRLDITVDDIVSEVIYQGDVLKYKIVKGRKIISDHEQSFGDDDRPIAGAYAMIIDKSGEVLRTELMTIKQIHQSWKQSKQSPFDDKGRVKPDSVHGKFPEDMAKRTVINKICKPIINSSSDATLLGQVIRQSSDEMDKAAFDAEYIEQANSTPLSIGTDLSSNESVTEHGEVIEGEVVEQPPVEEQQPSFAV